MLVCEHCHRPMTPAEAAFELRASRLMKGVWSVLVEEGEATSDTYIFKTEAEAHKWREAAVKCAEREDVYHVIFIPFRTFEESMEKFCASHDRDTDGEGEESDDEDDEDADVASFNDHLAEMLNDDFWGPGEDTLACYDHATMYCRTAGAAMKYWHTRTRLQMMKAAFKQWAWGELAGEITRIETPPEGWKTDEE